jgi:hypothetical protein
MLPSDEIRGFGGQTKVGAWWRAMTIRIGQELRDSASEFREMAATGSDVQLQEAPLMVAEEFEWEAERLEGHADELT